MALNKYNERLKCYHIAVFQMELAKGRRFLNEEMGYNCRTSLMTVPINFTDGEKEKYTNRFQNLDKDKKGYITPNDLRKFLEVHM